MGQVKLTDFGVSSELQNSIAMCATFVGTYKYMSPERIASKPYSYASDVWSLGIVIMTCVTGKYPYPEADTYIEMVQTILDSGAPRLPRRNSQMRDNQRYITPPPPLLTGRAWTCRTC